jgi:hypothetical protein
MGGLHIVICGREGIVKRDELGGKKHQERDWEIERKRRKEELGIREVG